MSGKRPNMSGYFRVRIDHHVRGMMSTATWERPPNIAQIRGDVTDPEIVVVMRDGTEWRWTGGRYAARKVNGCYAPLTPRPA